MSERAQKLKAIVKNTPEKASYGTDPKDPWSARANVTEDASLDKYLLSRGINPKYVTKNQLIAHSKSGQFQKWKHDHMFEEIQMEGKEFIVNSYHHMAIQELGLDLEPVAYCGDMIEAFKHTSRDEWGIVWHPERMNKPWIPSEIQNLLKV